VYAGKVGNPITFLLNGCFGIVIHVSHNVYSTLVVLIKVGFSVAVTRVMHNKKLKKGIGVIKEQTIAESILSFGSNRIDVYYR
jgi:hypothetical protein